MSWPSYIFVKYHMILNGTPGPGVPDNWPYFIISDYIVDGWFDSKAYSPLFSIAEEQSRTPTFHFDVSPSSSNVVADLSLSPLRFPSAMHIDGSGAESCKNIRFSQPIKPFSQVGSLPFSHNFIALSSIGLSYILMYFHRDHRCLVFWSLGVLAFLFSCLHDVLFL